MSETSSSLVVSGNPAAGQLKSALRTFLVALGGYLAGKGWFPPDLVGPLVPLILVAAPLVWGQLSVRVAKRQLVAAAVAHPDAVVLKP